MALGWTTRTAAAAAVVAVMVTSGCWWNQPGAGPGNTYHNASESRLTLANVATLEPVWSGRGSVSAVMDGKAVAVTPGPAVEVVAHDVSTGEELWTRTLTPPGATGGPTHPPVVSAGQVWAGYQAELDGDCVSGLVRLDLDSGDLVAEDTTGAPTELAPFGDQVALDVATFSAWAFGCMPSPSAGVRVVDASTAATSWSSMQSADRTVVTGESLFTFAGPTLRRYPAFGCGAPTCEAEWSTTPAGIGALSHVAGDATGPLVAMAASETPGTSLFLTIDPLTGQAIGSVELPYYGHSLALADGTAFVAGGTTLAAFDVEACVSGACAPQWTAALDSAAAGVGGLAVGGDVLYVAREDGVVEAYPAGGCGATTCAPVADVATDGPVSELVVSNGHLFVGSAGAVTAFAPA